MNTKNIDVIIDNLNEMKRLKEEDPECFWFDEYGSDLTWRIACRPIFKGDPPCLNDLRREEIGTRKFRENCIECKAKWLFTEYE